MRSASWALSWRNVDAREGDLPDVRELGVRDGHCPHLARDAHAKAQPQVAVVLLLLGDFVVGPGPDLSRGVPDRFGKLVPRRPAPEREGRVSQWRAGPDGADQLRAPGPAVDYPPLAGPGVRRDHRDFDPVPIERSGDFHFRVLPPLVVLVPPVIRRPVGRAAPAPPVPP